MVKVEVAGRREDELHAATQRQTAVRDFLTLALTRFHTVEQAESELRRDMKKDLKFYASDQWPTTIKSERQKDKRPCLTINRLPQFVKGINNLQRQAKPAIQINPVDDGADKQKAEVYQGLIRQIEVQSKADIAYMTAAESQVRMGRGWFRILTDYVDDRSHDQEIKIKRILNPFTVFMDHACEDVDYADARFAFIIEEMPRPEYEARYPDSAAARTQVFAGAGIEHGQDWAPEGKVRVAEYYYIESTFETVGFLRNEETGQITRANPDDIDLEDGATVTIGGQRITAMGSRDVETRTRKWAKINSVEVLEGNDDLTAGRTMPGTKGIPIVPVLGDEIDIDGRVDLRGLVRDAKDPQRMLNFWRTAMTETQALAPRVPWVGHEGQFAGHESKWNQANRRNFPYLEVKMVDLNGTPAPLPQRQAVEPPIQAMALSSAQAEQDLMAVTGRYPPSLGKPSRGEESGKAILARQRQGDLGSSDFLDNLGRSIRRCGELLVDLIPTGDSDSRPR